MDVDDRCRVTLPCHAIDCPRRGEIQPAEIEFLWRSIDWANSDCEMRLDLRLRIAGHEYECVRTPRCDDLWRFVRDLEAAHSVLQGSARLVNGDGRPILCLTVVDRGSGRFAVGGDFTELVCETAVESEGRFLGTLPVRAKRGVRVVFEGLVIDQSYVGEIVSRFLRTLRE